MSYNPNQPRAPKGSETGGQWVGDKALANARESAGLPPEPDAGKLIGDFMSDDSMQPDFEVAGDWKAWIRYVLDDGPARIEKKMGFALDPVSDMGLGSAVGFSIITPEEFRGQGIATEFMKKLMDASDKHNTPLIGEPRPFGPNPSLSLDQLFSFYEGLGLERYREDYVVYYPKGTK